MRDDRRDSGAGVEYDAGRRVLRVGKRQRRLSRRAGNRVVLQAYLELVAAQRPAAPRARVHLRDRDVDLLAELLDLTDDELEHQLADLLDLTDVEARELGRRLRAGRLRIAAAAIGLGVLGVAPLTHVNGEPSGQPPAPIAALETVVREGTPVPTHEAAPPTVAEPEPEPELGPSTVIVRTPEGQQLTYTESAPAPISEDGTDIGTALVIERG